METQTETVEKKVRPINRNNKKKASVAPGPSSNNENKDTKNKTESATPRPNRSKIPKDNRRNKSQRSQRPGPVSDTLPKSNLRIEELQQLEHRLSQTSHFKLINTTNKAKTYKIHLSKSDQYKLIIPYDESQPLKLQSYEHVEDANELDKAIRNVLNNFNSKAKSDSKAKKESGEKNCLFYVNYLINNYDNLKMEEYSFNEYETQKIKLALHYQR